MGASSKKAAFEIYFNRGIDDLGSWITTLKTHKVFKQGGAYYTYVDSKENEHKFMAKEFPTLLAENPELKKSYTLKFATKLLCSMNLLIVSLTKMLSLKITIQLLNKN